MDHFLMPVLVLIIWTLFMVVIMLAIRIPAMNKISPDAQKFIEDPSLFERLPNIATWTGNNHNHLHEQPTLFYALMFYLYLVNLTPDWMMSAAWAYVVLRIIHSFVESLLNKLILRFAIYSLATLTLIAMCTGAVLAL